MPLGLRDLLAYAHYAWGVIPDSVALQTAETHKLPLYGRPDARVIEAEL
jgi:hypothetical protein